MYTTHIYKHIIFIIFYLQASSIDRFQYEVLNTTHENCYYCQMTDKNVSGQLFHCLAERYNLTISSTYTKFHLRVIIILQATSRLFTLIQKCLGKYTIIELYYFILYIIILLYLKLRRVIYFELPYLSQLYTISRNNF